MKKRVKEKGLKNIRINSAGCLDRCEYGPAFVIYPEGTWYSPKSEADIDEIISVHIDGGGRVERLLMPSSSSRA
jgi:(2Fe-2S) ferredoxin